MKRAIAIALVLALVPLLSGWFWPRDMLYIEQADLTRSEEDMKALLSADNELWLVYDFRLDRDAASLCVRVWELVDGEWERFYAGSYPLEGRKGRLALCINDFSGGPRVAVQSQSGTVSTERKAEALNGNLGWGTAVLADRETLEYGRDVPLAVQVCAAGEVESPGLECFDEPELAAGKNYAHVYALTVCFNEEP